MKISLLKFLIIILKISQIFCQIISKENITEKILELYPNYPVGKYVNSECTLLSKNSKGICKKIDDCPRNGEVINIKEFCTFEYDVPLICCEIKKPVIDIENSNNNEVLDPINRFKKKLEKSNRYADKNCHFYHFFKFSKDFFFILEKSLAMENNPLMGAIGWQSSPESPVNWKCAGGLISKNFIITSAYCASEKGQTPNVVRIGDLELLTEERPGQQVNITRIFIHPDYNPKQNYHDIALIKFSPKIYTSELIHPSCLWTSNEIPANQLSVLGYGADAFGGPRTNKLFEGNLTLVDNESCSQLLGNNSQIPSGIIESQFCVKDLNGKIDTCQNASGGPILFRIGTGYSAVQNIVGIPTFGEFCNGPNTPAVYTRVSPYVEWIEPIVWSTENAN